MAVASCRSGHLSTVKSLIPPLGLATRVAAILERGSHGVVEILGQTQQSITHLQAKHKRQGCDVVGMATGHTP